jgi:hypothetical protein
MKVLKHTVQGFVDRRQLTLQNIEETRQQFEDMGKQFPTNEQLEFNQDADWSVLLTDVSVHVLVEKDRRKQWLSFVFNAGFVWDLASVPKFFRGIVDNDSQESIIAAMCHDAMFTGHLLPFHEANDVFYGLLRQAGESRFKSRIYWIAVASPVGRMMYNRKTIKRATWQLAFIQFEIESDVEC